MKALREIEALTDQALNSLDNLQAVEANPFLYSKIKNRMQFNRQNGVAKNTRVMLRLSAALLLFLGINILSIYLLNKQHNNTPQTGITAFSKAYFPQNDTYNY